MKIFILLLTFIGLLAGCKLQKDVAYVRDAGVSLSVIWFTSDSTFKYRWVEEVFEHPIYMGETEGTYTITDKRRLLLNSTHQPTGPCKVLVTDSTTSSDSITVTITYRDTFGYGQCHVVYIPNNKDDLFGYIFWGESKDIRYGDTLVLVVPKPEGDINRISFSNYHSIEDLMPDPLAFEMGKFPDSIYVELTDELYHYFTDASVKVKRRSVRIKQGGEYRKHRLQ